MAIELVTNHVFAEGSVKAISPLRNESNQWVFDVVGVGFKVEIAAVTVKTGADYFSDIPTLIKMGMLEIPEGDREALVNEVRILYEGERGELYRSEGFPLTRKYGGVLPPAREKFAHYVRQDAITKLL